MDVDFDDFEDETFASNKKKAHQKKENLEARFGKKIELILRFRHPGNRKRFG